VLPPQYPLRPPSFRFLTPTGRFEVNREICLSISGHHEETWQPAWGIRTALVAMRSFMDTDAKGQLGGLEATKEVRERMAREGAAWRCGVCAKTNGVILKEREELGAERAAQEEAVPEELRLAYRDELGQKDAKTEKQAGPATEAASSSLPPAVNDTVAPPPNPLPVAPAAPVPTRTVQAQPPVVRQIVRPSPDRSLAWIDTCIYGIGAALIFLVLKKFAS
jgi:ubiquitin-conjugating enzyme E2 J1